MPENFIAVSISHHRAPVEVRERLQLSEVESRKLLEELRKRSEALVLSTCNRTEVYAMPLEEHTLKGHVLIDQILALKKMLNESDRTYPTYFETYQASEAIEKLFRVTAGIDSQIIGDQQIFAQVKDAFRISGDAEASGGFLGKLGQAAFRVGKRVITETTLTEGAATISYAAVEFARKIYDDLRSRHILIIGAGETGELAAKHFIERNAGRLTIANRSLENAQAMLARTRPTEASSNCEAISLDDIESALPKADIILSATSAPGYIITAPMMEAALKARESSSPVVMIDIAVPRDIDPEIGKLSNVFLKDIDDLRTIVNRNAERRRQEIPKAEAIIEEELARFLESLSHLEAGPTIKELREKFEAVRAEELERHRAKLDDKSFATMDEMSRRMMNRLLHTPTIALKETNGEANERLTRIETIRKLFALDKDANGN